MFRKILVANRGEIACRIIRTCRRMGIATVAVYSDADARAPHVALADEAVRLGPAPAAESYLRVEAILDAIRASGADAVHPGYGFLSERPDFAELLLAKGIGFIGPPPAAIAAMGDKIASKKVAEAAGVSIVPGFLGEVRDADHAAQLARSIGYPIMLKASAGGGGKGMRVAAAEADLRDSYDAVRREALAGFGDDRLLIERFIENPRHIEIQLLGDRHGTLVHLGERECSIQRRHQKVIEEAPSPFVTLAMREDMADQAIALARAVGYHSAGTVEFIAAPDRSFYFLEMNTRLQVEHPVTECVTGLDLVEQMIRVAAGEPLGFGQADVRLTGWAIETRVYAEDPYRGFVPATGRLVRYRPPSTGEVAPGVLVRVDDGVVEGSEITMFYDPMIAKLVTHAPSRDAAIEAQLAALGRFVIDGSGNNIDFLSALLQHPRFRVGALSTGFITEEYPDGFAGAALTEALAERLSAVAALVARADAEHAGTIDGQIDGRPAVPDEWIVRLDGAERRVRIDGEAVSVDGRAMTVDAPWTAGRQLIEAFFDGEPLPVRIQRARPAWRLAAAGVVRDMLVLRPRAAELMRHMIAKPPPDRSRQLLSPMPGLLRALHVAAGARVETGQPLAVVEAMKMENLIRSARTGRIAAVHVAVGESLTADQLILEFD